MLARRNLAEHQGHRASATTSCHPAGSCACAPEVPSPTQFAFRQAWPRRVHVGRARVDVDVAAWSRPRPGCDHRVGDLTSAVIDWPRPGGRAADYTRFSHPASLAGSAPACHRATCPAAISRPSTSSTLGEDAHGVDRFQAVPVDGRVHERGHLGRQAIAEFPTRVHGSVACAPTAPRARPGSLRALRSRRLRRRRRQFRSPRGAGGAWSRVSAMCAAGLCGGVITLARGITAVARRPPAAGRPQHRPCRSSRRAR